MSSDPRIAWLIRSALHEPPDALPSGRAEQAPRLDDGQWLWSQSVRNRIELLLVEAVNSGQVGVTDELLEKLVDRHPTLLSTMVHLEAAGLSAFESLDDAGIDVRALKGLATAHLDYPNPALRQFSDVDLLVKPEQFEDAVDALRQAGHHRKLAIRGNRWQLQHAITIDVDGFELDLHHRLLHQAAGHLAAKLDLFASPQRYEVAGAQLLALPAPLRLIQAAGQNVLSARADTKYSSDIDVLRLMGAADEAYELANVVGLGWLLDLGITRAHGVAGLAPPPPMGRGTAGERVLASIYRQDHPSAVRIAAGEALVAPALVTAQTLWSVISPGQEYLETRNRSRWDQLRHQTTRIGAAAGIGARMKRLSEIWARRS